MADFKKRAGGIARGAAGKAKTFALFAAKKTKNVSRIAKLNVDIAGERDTIKQVYSEIGKLYYETHREHPEGFFVQLCQEIDNSFEAIADMEAQIVRLKNEDHAAGSRREPEAPVADDDDPPAPDGE